MKTPTFDEFISEMFMYVFDGLVTGGTKEMKSRFTMAINNACMITQSGGFAAKKKD